MFPVHGISKAHIHPSGVRQLFSWATSWEAIIWSSGCGRLSVPLYAFSRYGKSNWETWKNPSTLPPVGLHDVHRGACRYPVLSPLCEWMLYANEPYHDMGLDRICPPQSPVPLGSDSPGVSSSWLLPLGSRSMCASAASRSILKLPPASLGKGQGIWGNSLIFYRCVCTAGRHRNHILPCCHPTAFQGPCRVSGIGGKQSADHLSWLHLRGRLIWPYTLA